MRSHEASTVGTKRTYTPREAATRLNRINVAVNATVLLGGALLIVVALSLAARERLYRSPILPAVISLLAVCIIASYIAYQARAQRRYFAAQMVKELYEAEHDLRLRRERERLSRKQYPRLEPQS